MKLNEVYKSHRAEYGTPEWERQEQKMMDMEKRDFKRNELEHELRHETESSKEYYHKPKYSISSNEEYTMKIDGKVWSKGGKPVIFVSKGQAEAVKNKILQKSPNKRIEVQKK
jgi:hypothetical protein